MKYFSMFSGIGGFELGIGDRGKCIGYSEIDKWAIEVYNRRFPGHINYGDATKINPNNLPDFDLLVGGFPCQAFSVAGKRCGFDDTRGTLFFEIARILENKRPRYMVLENVKGLLSHDKGKTFQTILEVLTDLGYRVQWQILNSKDFGVPQNRERIFIIGHLRGEPRPEVFPIIGATEETINKINFTNRRAHNLYKIDGISPTLISAQGGNSQPKIIVALTERRTEEAKKIRREMQKQGKDWSPRRGKELVPRNDGLSNCLTSTPSKEHYLTDGYSIRRLTPLECERLQGFPDGWTEGLSDTQRYKTLGNAVTVNVIQAMMEKLLC